MNNMKPPKQYPSTAAELALGLFWLGGAVSMIVYVWKHDPEPPTPIISLLIIASLFMAAKWLLFGIADLFKWRVRKE